MEFDTEELILVIFSSSFSSASHTGDLLLQSFRRMSSHLLSSIIRYQLVRCLIPPFFWTGCFDGSFPVGRITDVQEREPCATSNYPDLNPCCRYFWPVDIRLVENVLALCQSPFPLAADVLPNESRVWTPFHLIQTYFLVQLKIASDQAALAFWTYRGIWGRLDRGDPPSRRSNTTGPVQGPSYDCVLLHQLIHQANLCLPDIFIRNASYGGRSLVASGEVNLCS